MQFASARPDVVRAIKQRWLLKLWQSHLRGNRVPRWQSLGADTLKSMSENLSLLDVSAADGQAHFTVRFHGLLVAKTYGSADYQGRNLNEILPPGLRAHGLEPYVKAADGDGPIYTIHDMKDGDGHLVHCERLLLPFAADGQNVDRILGSFEFVSPDGAFEPRDLLRLQNAPPLRLAVQITASASD